MNLDNLRFCVLFCVSSVSNLKQYAVNIKATRNSKATLAFVMILFSISVIGIFLRKPLISRNATSNAPSSRINSRREHFFVSFMRAPCSSLPLLLFFVCPTCVSHLSLRSTKLRQFKLVTSSRLFLRIVSRSLNYALKLFLQFLDIFFFFLVACLTFRGDESLIIFRFLIIGTSKLYRVN